MAYSALMGVGDGALGEWREKGMSGVFHIRRRLTMNECKIGGDLVMIDIRGTNEERRRFEVVAREHPDIAKMLRTRGMLGGAT